MISGVLADVRFAFRSFRQEPGWTAAVVLTLAVGIGAATAIHAVFNFALFRPVPGVAAPDSLVTLYVQPADRRPVIYMVPHVDLEAMRTNVPAFSGVASCQAQELPFRVQPSDVPQTIETCSATRGYFDVLGARARLGRLFAEDEAETGGAGLAVISERLWRSAFAADRSVIGRDVVVNSDRFTVIGVVATFRGERQLGTTDLWVPFSAPSGKASAAATSNPRGGVHQTMVARLRPGAVLAQAQAQAEAVFARVDVAEPSATRGISVESPQARAAPGMARVPVVYAGLNNGPGTLTRARLLTTYVTLMAGVALLLLLACANAANLLLARNIGRRRELAIRAAIGASRGRVFRQLLVECTVLAAGAAAFGLGIGAALAGLFRGTRILSYLPALEDLTIDWRVAAFSASVGAAAVLIFGLGPGLIAARADPQHGLRESFRATRTAGRLRTVLMCAQLALSLALVATAGVLTETVSRLRSLDLGVDPTGVVTFSLKPYVLGYDSHRAGMLFRGIIDRLEAVPAVQSAAVVAFTPFGENQYVERVRGVAQTPGTESRVIGRFVSARYFSTLGIPVVAGRSFTDRDRSSAPGSGGGVAIVSQSLARGLFGDAPAAGRPIVIKGFNTDETYEVVGVVGDTRSAELRTGFDPVVYRPAAGKILIGTVLMRTSLSGMRAIAVAQRAVQSIEPGLPLESVSTIREDIDRLIAVERILAKLAGLLAALGVLLATTGVHAVVAFFMRERTREFGIRVALGATRARVTRSVVRGVLVICAASVVAGLGLVAAASRLLVSRVYGVSPLDPATLVGAIALLVTAALLTAWLPARRAAKMDPMIALRTE